jgi:hypothetical protein
MSGSNKHERCECYDFRDGHPEKPAEANRVESGRCSTVGRLRRLYRVDMYDDEKGMAFCAHCAADAEASGLFGDFEPAQRPHR